MSLSRSYLVLLRFLLVVFGCGYEAAAASISVTDRFTISSWTTENGLPENTVLGIASGADGYLWVGTWNGLARFDGVRFVPFRLREGLHTLLTHRLLKDRQERLWIGTLDGGLLVRHPDGRFHTYTRGDGLPGESVRALTEDSEGRIWVAMDGGLVRWDGARFVDFSPPEPGTNQIMYNWVSSANGAVWAVSDRWNIWEWRNNQWRLLPALESPSHRFDRVFATRDGRLWSQLIPNGLSRLETNHWRFFGPESGLPESYIWSVLEQADSDLLCGSYDLGLYLFRDGHAKPVALNEPTNQDGVLSLLDDRQGNLWAGTRTHGLVRLRRPQVLNTPGTEAIRIARVAFDNRGRLWAGGNSGLFIEQDGRLTRVPDPEGSQWLPIGALLARRAGGVWISILGDGIWRFDPERDARPSQILKSAGGSAWIPSMADDGSGGLWFGTGSGRVGHFSNNQVELFGTPDLARGKRIVSIIPEESGGLWIATEGAGVIRLDARGEVMMRLTAVEGLPLNSVRSLLRDRDGTLWIGTAGGLCRWRNSRLSLFDSRHGLPDETISSLIEDAQGHLWCTANATLFRLDKQQLDEVVAGRAISVQPLVLGRGDGLESIPFITSITPNAVAAPDGRLYFPRTEGVVMLDPAQFGQRSEAIQVVIEEVSIDGQNVKLPADADTPLLVPPGSAQIDLRYTALRSSAPERLLFRYRFDGLDTAWKEAGGERMASFRRLPAGTYRFRVTASDGSGQWVDPGTILAFVVQPFFWQTLWFRALVGLACLGAVVVLYWRRLRAGEERRKAQEAFSRHLIEQQEVERKRVASELHDSLGQSLLIIKNRALLGLGAKGTETTHYQEISHAASQALKEVRQIAYNLRPYQLDQFGLTEAIEAIVEKVGTSGPIHFVGDLDPIDGIFAPGAESHIFRVIQEATNNILKHAGATKARIVIQRNPRDVRFVVSDNGHGFASDHHGATADSVEGVGLPGMRERVRILGGTIEITSSPGGGTTITMIVPIPAQQKGGRRAN